MVGLLAIFLQMINSWLHHYALLLLILQELLMLMLLLDFLSFIAIVVFNDDLRRVMVLNPLTITTAVLIWAVDVMVIVIFGATLKP